jgi:hypothetical protein
MLMLILGGGILSFQEVWAGSTGAFLPLLLESGSLRLYIEGLFLVLGATLPRGLRVSSILTLYGFLNRVALNDAKAERVTES